TTTFMRGRRGGFARARSYDALMSDGGPLGGGGDPFGGLPFFGDLLRMLQSQGPSWDTAKQLAVSLATDGTAEVNVDPSERIQLEQLGRVADLHVARVTGLDTAPHGKS